jgi:5-formyltetrahydrofolate cyclo-ligase
MVKLADKESIRAEALNRRLLLSYDQNLLAQAFLKQFEKHIGFENLGHLGFYWPLASEADPRLIAAHYSTHHSGICALPVFTHDKREMDFYRWREDMLLLKGQGGIFVPQKIDGEAIRPDSLIIPLVAVNKQGHRIGFGKGNYDATIGALKKVKDITTIGLCYDEQIIDINWDLNKYDEALDFILTPTKFFRV